MLLVKYNENIWNNKKNSIQLTIKDLFYSLIKLDKY